MLIKSKYKIARRLGIPVFEKTQTQKFALSLGRRGEKGRKHPRTFTDFGKQLTEKQKIRYTYLVNERQLKRYVSNVLTKRGIKQDDKLYETLETRLDSVAYRLGFGPTRLAVRQLVTHGHCCVNGHRVDIPSHPLKIGDRVSIRPESQTKKVFLGLSEKLKDFNPPAWLSLDAEKKEGVVKGSPKLEAGTGLDFNTVLEFYKR
ncbi:MAG TPA: 30S ribosomal protein S4 [Candidatus Paceibacterota bacterium]